MGKRGPKPKVSREQLLDWAGRGVTREEAAAERACNWVTVHNAEQRYGIWLHPLPEDVGRKVARALHAQGVSPHLIMTVLQRSEMTISRYLRPPGWEHGTGQKPAPGYEQVTALMGADSRETA